MKPKNEERGMRRGFLIAVVCLGGLTLLPMLYLHFKPAHHDAPAPAPETSVAQPSPPPRPMMPVAPRRTARSHRWAAPAKPAPTLEDLWGIQVCSLRLSMANSIVDLRYKVTNPQKAALLANGKTAAYIVDHATGKKLIMPTPPKEGAFPPTANKLAAGKTYFSMVSNQGGALKSGSEVTVVVGGSQATNLTVE
jgi:hypothetical protein